MRRIVGRVAATLAALTVVGVATCATAAADDSTASPSPLTAPTPTEPAAAAATEQPPAPSSLPDPVVTITCTGIDVEVHGPPDSGRQFAWAQGRAEKGTPAFQPLAGPLGERFLFQLTIDPGQATAWIFQVRAADGTVLWSRSGTTVTCAPEPKLKFAAPYHPVEPVAACGKTLADLQFPNTPGIVYSYDEWNAYARLQPGWIWDYDAFYPPHAWWISDSSTSDLAWLPRSAFFMDMVGCPRYASIMAPESQHPDSPTWKGIGTATTARAAGTAPKPSTTPTLPAVAPSVGAPSESGLTVAPAPGSTNEARAASRAPTPTPTAGPTPAPSPTATASALADPRVATTTGLGVASGLAGACVLAATGAFVVRKRLRPEPNVVVLDESGADEPVD